MICFSVVGVFVIVNCVYWRMVERIKSRSKSFSMCLLQFLRMIDNYIGIIPNFWSRQSIQFACEWEREGGGARCISRDRVIVLLCSQNVHREHLSSDGLYIISAAFDLI